MNNTNTNVVDVSTLAVVSQAQAVAARRKGELVFADQRVKKDLSQLPRVKEFRVEIKGGAGTAENWHCTGWLVYLRVRGNGEYQEASALAASCGMKIKGSYKSEDEAVAAAWDMIFTWGREKKARAPLTEEEKKARKIARLQKQLAKLQA